MPESVTRYDFAASTSETENSSDEESSRLFNHNMTAYEKGHRHRKYDARALDHS